MNLLGCGDRTAGIRHFESKQSEENSHSAVVLDISTIGIT